MNKSESIIKLSQAMAKAQAEVNHALLDSKNPHFRSDYASLESCLNAAKPVMGKYGLALMQSGDRSAEGDMVLTSLLTHESGEWVQFQMPLVLSKQDMQGLGSALTYGRRYSLCGILGIGSDDDDGSANADSLKPQAPQQQQPMPPQQKTAPQRPTQGGAYTVGFGKHKGKTLDEMGEKDVRSYLMYLLGEMTKSGKDPLPSVKAYIDEAKKYLDQKSGNNPPPPGDDLPF